MGKYRSFLGIFASLFVLFFTGSVMAAGYTCPEYKKYTSCSTNYYMSGGQVAGNSCNQCGENSTSKGGTQSYCQCDTGYTVDGQLLNTASENTKPDDGSDCQLASVTCEPGTYFQFAKSGVGCMACVAGKWCPGGVFYWTGEEHQGVNDCPAGYTSKGGATAENECFINVEAGHYLPTENSAEPQTCAAGTSKAAHTVNYGSKSECDVCSDNQYSDAGAASCTSCNTDNGYGNTGDSASNHAGIASCTIQCPADQYVATAGEGCVSVGDGNWSDGTEVVAQDEVGTLNQCPANYRDGAAASSQAECITSCDAGEYVETANAACTSIGTGYYKEAHTVKYGSTSSRNQCPENYRDGAPVGAEADCLGIMERIGERKTPPTPDGCADITVQACEPRTCEYQKKYGTNGDGAITQDCDSVDELSCTDTITKVEASENHYSDGLTCPACESGYTSEQGATTAVQCIKSCTVACINPGSGACPENSSSCTWNTNESQTGTQNQVEKKCSVTAKQCTLKDFVCKTGYDKSGQTCIPHAYEVSYSCGTGTGNAPGGTSQKYNSNYYIANNTCEKPGNKFMGWNDGSKTVQPGQITWTYTQNITFTAVWQPCDEDTSAKGQCYCSANQYPNGDGSCDNCVIQCSASEEVYTLGSYDVCDNGTDDECYRSCTTSDVANSSEVSGTITKGGAGECAATSCNKNFYLSGIGCAACVPNATCPGGEEPFKCNPGYHLSEDSSSCEPDEYTITLKKNGGTGTVNGATGANDAVQTCKHGQMCTLPNGAGLERVGYAFTGWGDTAGCTSGKYQEVFTAAAIRYACWTQTFEQCQSGKYYNGSTHVTCPEGMFCPGTGNAQVGNAGCGSECPEPGTSPAGSTSNTACYITCSGGAITGGTANADKDKVNWTGSAYPTCTFTVTCDAGYIAKNQGTATATCEKCIDGVNCPGGSEEGEPEECPAGSYCEDGVAKKCPAGGTSAAGAESINDCYKTCEPTLDIDNGQGISTGNAYYSGSAYPECQYRAQCDENYTAKDSPGTNPSCVAKTYTITLDKNGGIGSIAGSVECTFDSGNCTLPATSGLTRTGYTTGNRWCADAAGNSPCYYAGQSTGTNISADGTDTTLYAMWTPNVYTVNLDHNTATVDGAPDTVYLKYATGWFSNEGATESITKLTTVPEKSSYNFVGYYSMASNGTQIVNASGAFLTTENALTFTTDEPATIYARWSAGTTNCAAGTYYPGTGDQCVACTANHYCPGGMFATDSGSPEGLNACPQDGVSPSNSDEISDCYKTKLAYSALHGDGTQTCNYDPDSQSYSANCTDKVIEVCDAGYYLADAENENPDCDVVGTGYYNGGGSTERTQCPNGGSTETETSTMVQQCFKTGLPYEARYGSGTQRCFYTSGDGADAIYQRDCDTKVIDSCRGGYWLENPGDTDCVEVGQNYYSDSSDTSRYACPANGKTHGTISDSILLCYKDGLPYTQAQHGTGEYLCFYTSGEGDSAVYASSCETPTMTSCDAGYYYDHLVLPTDCMEVTKGWYSPAIDTSRHQCPMGGTTATSTSAAITECYRDDMACDIENGSGEQTCNYDEADSNYTADCQTCNVTMCDEGFSQVGNTCINCPAGSVCDEGQQQTCSSLTDGMYPESDAGTDDVAMCYRDCPLADNAAAMAGRDYYDALDTCEIKRCAAGYTLDNGQCVECPEGSFCDGTTDPENPGDDVKSCADLGDGEWSMSLPGATDESGCYQTCEPYEITNGTAVPVSDKAFYPNECEYRGESDTGNPCEIIDGVCVETSCNAGYEMKDGVCVECNREFALAYKDGGVCLIAECVLGYHPNGDKCEPNIQSCEAPNAISAERVWDSGKQAFGACMIRECEYGFHLSSNACVPDTQPCEVENGSGYKEWDSATNAWGECIATLCNPGYTNDPAETNERTKQCGECKNRYSVLGKLAASSYVQGCEIASCMYQGELYNLENNECVPICPMTEYEDDTGTMVWDDSRKKCVRTCKEGYTMW